MKRSEVIGTCLVNSEYYDDLDTATEAVELLFSQTFPKEDFSNWNKNVPSEKAQYHIAQMLGKSEIDFKYMVTILSREHHANA